MIFWLILAAALAAIFLFVPTSGERDTPPDRTCQWCHGMGTGELPCPARSHQHNSLVVCGKCNGTGIAPTLERQG